MDMSKSQPLFFYYGQPYIFRGALIFNYSLLCQYYIVFGKVHLQMGCVVDIDDAVGVGIGNRKLFVVEAAQIREVTLERCYVGNSDFAVTVDVAAFVDMSGGEADFSHLLICPEVINIAFGGNYADIDIVVLLRRVIKADQWSLGGQIDLMYGTDYYYMTSTGLETTTENLPHINGQEYDQAEYRANYSKYGMAIPQFFAEIYVPLLNGVDVKLGHFNSIMGFESNQATQNFFYSRSYQSVYGLPTSMTGVITDWKIGQCFSIIAGGVNEWNAFCTSGDENFSFIVGATYENLCGNFAVSALVMNGKQRGATFMPYGYPEDAYDTTLFNLILKYKFTDRLAYVGEFTYGNNDTPVVTWDGDEFQGRNWYGFSNYLFYVVNEHVTFGARFEWFQDKENTVMTGGNRVTVQNTPANYFAWSFGVNWEPFTWLNIRPEVRWDYSDLEIEGVPNGYAFDNGTSKTQFTFGLDAIVKF